MRLRRVRPEGRWLISWGISSEVKWLEIEAIEAHPTPDPVRNPESPRWRASLIQNSNVVENYVGTIAAGGS